ncbi:MAG: autoinducer-2 kinase [Thaumarchaeota archaeon]|nr:autoinducer-2 kinase [Nitrososphaerota archaeon]
MKKNSSKEHVLAVDAGTGSCRAVIFDRDGRQISFSQREWSHRPARGYPGSSVFDTKSNWSLISLCIRDSIVKSAVESSSIKAVSTTSMREGIVLYDESGKEIWACPNIDSRAREEAEELVKSGEAEKIYFISGDWVSITSAPRFNWIRKHQPHIFRRIAHMSMLSDWILYRLSGEFVTEPSIGSSSGMFDLKKRTWSPRIIELCNLDREVFPRVYPSGTVVGSVTKKAAIETHLDEGTPVVVGGADTQLGLTGIGVANPGQVTILGGSFWQTTILSNKPVVDPDIRLRTICGAVPGQWMLEGIGFYCGWSLRWFRDAFCQAEKEEARKLGIDPYELMERQASSVPAGSSGVIGIFSNLMNSKKWIHASPSFLQFDISNPTQSGKKECIRAIEEAAAYVSLGHLRIIQSITNSEPEELTFAGGGAKSFLWPQILSDVLGLRVKIPEIKESSALGAAICAGVGAGFYESLREGAAGLVKIERSFEPRPKIHKEYSKLYDNWLKIYDENLRISETGLLNPLWRAAGT